MTNNKPNRILLFAYFYPPLGGPAVQRPCKTVKYLSQLGWETDVITIKDIVYHSLDSSLLSECNHSKVFRTASLDLMYLLNLVRKFFKLNTDKLYFNTPQSQKGLIKKFFPIDDKVGWMPFAIKAGKQAVLTNKYHAVMVTCGPFSSVLAAALVAKFGRLPLVFDYRDHWTLNNSKAQPKGLMQRIQQRMEKQLLQSSALISTATVLIKQDLLKHFGNDLEPKILPFYNGYDEADFADRVKQRTPDNTIRIAYVGTLYGDRPLSYFLSAMQQASTELKDTKLELLMVGNFYLETLQEVQAAGVDKQVTFIEQQPHLMAIQNMLDADILLLVIGDSRFNWIVTGKLFEYLRCQKPILTLANANSEAAKILQECGHQGVCEINDTQAIYEQLTILINNHLSGSNDYKIPTQYERYQQVKNLHEKLLHI